MSQEKEIVVNGIGSDQGTIHIKDGRNRGHEPCPAEPIRLVRPSLSATMLNVSSLVNSLAV